MFNFVCISHSEISFRPYNSLFFFLRYYYYRAPSDLTDPSIIASFLSAMWDGQEEALERETLTGEETE